MQKEDYLLAFLFENRNMDIMFPQTYQQYFRIGIVFKCAFNVTASNFSQNPLKLNERNQYWKGRGYSYIEDGEEGLFDALNEKVYCALEFYSKNEQEEIEDYVKLCLNSLNSFINHNFEEMSISKASCPDSVQAKAFLDTVCIFVGFSGQDYNFRRILKNRETHNMLRESGMYKKHYMLYCIDDIAKNFYRKKDRDTASTDDELIARIASPDYHYEKNQFLHFLCAQYLYWSHYNVIPIWTTFGELPSLIRTLNT